MVHCKPTTFKQAMTSPEWLHAMKIEYGFILKMRLRPSRLPPHRKTIDNEWVFKVKENPDGSISKYKARLVDKGFH